MQRKSLESGQGSLDLELLLQKVDLARGLLGLKVLPLEQATLLAPLLRLELPKTTLVLAAAPASFWRLHSIFEQTTYTGSGSPFP